MSDAEAFMVACVERVDADIRRAQETRARYVEALMEIRAAAVSLRKERPTGRLSTAARRRQALR